MLFITLILIAGILIFYWFRKSMEIFSHWERKGIKYLKPLPFFGNFLPSVTKSKSMCEMIQYFYKAFPDERYFGIYQFSQPVLVIKDLELIKSIAIKNFENFVDHTGFIPADADPLWGKNLFATTGDRWKDLRQTMSPVFTSSKMRNMFVLMDECAKQLVEYFNNKHEDVIEVELKDVVIRYTNDIIASTAFGIKCDSLRDKDNEFLAAGRNLSDFTGLKRFKFIFFGIYPKLCKFLGIKLVSTKVGNFFKSIISETIDLREKNQIVRPDLIHLLMLSRKGKLKYEEVLTIPEAGFAAVRESQIGISNNNSNFLSIEDITAQAIVFYLGGQDTVATNICFAGYELALNRKVQKKLKDEIAEVTRECGGKITYEILLKMKYLDMVVSETLRKWSQAIWLDRKCTKPFEIEPQKNGETTVKINLGDVCWFPVFAIHWDPKYYPNPEVFDPERFNDENKDKIQSCTYLPFGLGPRNCIGSRYALLATKIWLYYLLLNFDFVKTSKTVFPIKISPNSVMLQPKGGGFHIGLKKNKICY